MGRLHVRFRIRFSVRFVCKSDGDTILCPTRKTSVYTHRRFFIRFRIRFSVRFHAALESCLVQSFPKFKTYSKKGNDFGIGPDSCRTGNRFKNRMQNRTWVAHMTLQTSAVGSAMN
jgi:hypothetical protein